MSSDRCAQEPTAGPTPAGRARLTTIIGRIKAMARAIGALPFDIGNGPVSNRSCSARAIQVAAAPRKAEDRAVLLDWNLSLASSPATAIKKKTVLIDGIDFP